MEPRHQTEHQNFFIIFEILCILIHLNCASGAAPHHGVTTPDSAPDFLIFSYLFLNYLNRALGAAPQQRVSAPDRAPDFFCFNLFILICFNSVSGAAPQLGVRHQTGHKSFVLLRNYNLYFNLFI
jgi:hypothetical protein